MEALYKRYPNLWDNLVWLLWAVGYSLCFPVYNATPLIWIVFIPVLVYAYRMPFHKTVRYAFLYGLVFWWLTLFWLVAFHEASLPFFSPGYSLYFAFFFFFIAYYSKKVGKFRWIIFPLFWVSVELLRSVGYLGFQWNLVGNVLWRNPVLLQSADIWGVWGVSFIILLVNGVLAEVVDKWIDDGNIIDAIKKKKAPVIICVSVFVFNLVYGVITYNYYKNMSENAPKEKLALMQPNIGSHDPWWARRWENYAMIWKLHADAMTYQPDMIVWSETMVRNYIWHYRELYHPDSEVNRFNERILNLPFEFDVPILLTHPEVRDGKTYNSATYIDPEIGEYEFYGKIHLVPFGEWMPYYQKIPVVREVLRQAGAAAYSPGEEFKIFQSRRARFAVLICFEDVFGVLARRFVLNGANYFLNTTNDGWAYRWQVGTQLPLWQHVAAVVPVAVSVRRPIARAVNTGVTGVFDLNGDMSISPVPLYERGVFVDEISIIDDSVRSIYVRFGFMFPYIVFFISFAIMAYTVLLHKDKAKQGDL